MRQQIRLFSLFVGLLGLSGFVTLAAEPTAPDTTRLIVLFLGDRGLHQPADRYAQLAPVLAGRGIDLTYTEDVLFFGDPGRVGVDDQRIVPAELLRVQVRLAGLSMGGGQSLNFGLAHLDTFAWVDGFSSAPNTKAPEELVPEPAAAKEKLKLLWVACGNEDGLIRISQGAHAYLKEKGVPHVWDVDGHAHDRTEWKNNLYLFAQKLVR